MTEPTTYLLLVAAGVIASILNVVAGGGSFLTLPLLIFLGLPVAIANGTNRIGVLTQNASAAWGFQRASVLDWRWALTASVPALVGSAAGAWASLHVGDELFRRVLAVAMVTITLATLFAPDPRPDAKVRPAQSWSVLVGFGLVGVYGGFLQAGVGFLILAITTWCGLDLVRGNAVKVTSVLLGTVMAASIFALTGSVHWPMAIALAIGNAIGGAIGVRLAVARGHRWLKGVVTVTIVALAVRLWWS